MRRYYVICKILFTVPCKKLLTVLCKILLTAFVKISLPCGGKFILPPTPCRKTALALNITQNIALRGAKQGEAPKRIAVFSLEMSGDQLVQRMICTEADAGAETIHTGDPEASAVLRNRLWEAAAMLDEAHIFIDDTPGLSILDMWSRAHRLKAKGGLNLIVIDDLQLMQVNVGRKGTDTPSQITELIVAKHQNGPTGRVTLFFKKDCTKFVSLSRKRGNKK